MSLAWFGSHLQQYNISRDPCASLSLRKGGSIVFNDTYTVQLITNVVYEPDCTGHPKTGPREPFTVLDIHEHFYSSILPQIYALAAATVLAYVLSIILFITPRTFFIGGRGGGFLGSHGMISGSYGNNSVVGVGGRPWLQKVAALTVAISLTIASADSFSVAKEQYELGFMDSIALTNKVADGLELRIIRVISNTFLWLAQVQTLIRLFPRHKEKVIIKWVGFALIVLDTIFSILNNFVHRGRGKSPVHPKNFNDAIPTLNYLFELSLSVLYAAWVVFYSLSKHRFAYFHVKMRNICLVALFSLLAVLIPVVFFILDVSKPNVAGWGEYIRWVGAAAASVVVWEWVERIEALEREERKDGILGREIFDGDDMLEVTSTEELDRPNTRNGHNDRGGGDGSPVVNVPQSPSRLSRRFQNRLRQQIYRKKRRKIEGGGSKSVQPPKNTEPVIPPVVATPVNREDTRSATSTVYRVRYHSTDNAGQTASISEDLARVDEGEKEISTVSSKDDDDDNNNNNMPTRVPSHRVAMGWLNAVNPFGKRRGSPPQEVATAQAEEGMAPTAWPVTELTEEKEIQWKLTPRFQSILSYLPIPRNNSSKQPNSDPPVLPVTVIPARGNNQSTNDRNLRSRTANSNEQRTVEVPPPPPLPVIVVPARPRSSRTWSTHELSESRRSVVLSGQTSSNNNSILADRGTPSSTDTNNHSGTNSVVLATNMNRGAADDPSPSPFSTGL